MSAKKEHGPEQACYSGGPGHPYYQPFIACLCGEWSLREESWEEVGAAFDEHLAKNQPEPETEE